MAEKNKLTPDEKLEILLHILNLIDEQNTLSYTEDKFGAYFNAEIKPFIEKYLLDMNSRKALQFLVYGEPGMVNEHFIKISNFQKFSKEIRMQLDLIKARNKDIVLALNEEVQTLSGILAEKEKVEKNGGSEEVQARIEMKAKIDSALDYSKKLSVSLKKNHNLSVLDGVVQDTQSYLNTVKAIAGEYEDMREVIINPLIEENRKSVQTLTTVAISAVAVMLVLAGVLLVLT